MKNPSVHLLRFYMNLQGILVFVVNILSKCYSLWYKLQTWLSLKKIWKFWTFWNLTNFRVMGLPSSWSGVKLKIHILANFKNMIFATRDHFDLGMGTEVLDLRQ